MEKISFHPIASEDREPIRKMILDFYEKGLNTEEGKSFALTVEKTIERSFSHPDQLKIIGFKDQHSLIGYALLCLYWSNEYGGVVVLLDELYTIPSYRNKGIGTQFLTTLNQSEEYVRILLEVFPENTKAFELYKRMGFEVVERIFMTKSV